MAPTFTAPRVVTTTHAADGKSIVAFDGQVSTFAPFGPAGTSFATFHSAPKVPVSAVGDATIPPTTAIPRPPPEGLTFGISDFAPGNASPMHRSITLDYAIVLSGEITMTLDSGEEKVVKAGEFVLQRGTMHAWANRGTEPCRVAFVMLGSEKVVLADGKVLEAEIVRPK